MLKSFVETFTPCKSHIYFQGTVMYIQYEFLYLILTRPELTVHMHLNCTEYKEFEHRNSQ
jgi:hypothetical protein